VQIMCVCCTCILSSRGVLAILCTHTRTGSVRALVHKRCNFGLKMHSHSTMWAYLSSTLPGEQCILE
jgi:hypothetical protein